MKFSVAHYKKADSDWLVNGGKFIVTDSEYVLKGFLKTVARFERNRHTYYAEFDQESIRKPIYGEKYGDDSSYVYTLALRDNKTIKASPTRGLNPVHSVGNASTDIISKNPEKSIENTKISFSKEFSGKKYDVVDGVAVSTEVDSYVLRPIWRYRDWNGTIFCF